MPEHLFAPRGAAVLQSLLAPESRAADPASPPLPAYVADFLVRLRLAHGVPFDYLVPDPALLPDESIRFFTVDEGWLDALMEGAMAVGSSGTKDTDHVAQALPVLRAAVRDAVPLAAAVRRRTVDRGAAAAHVRAAVTVAAELPDPGGTPPLTGFLLRSGIVSGWPGFSVRAFTTADIPEQADPSTIDPSLFVPILRLEQLSPSVLLVLFAGTPALVWLEEPHHGIQLGIDPGDRVAVVTPTGKEVTEPDAHGEETPKTVAVPMRGGPVAGVVDVAGLVQTLAQAHAADDRVAPQGGSAALALQLLRPPYRQRFSADENG
jgi:hypothetical protein